MEYTEELHKSMREYVETVKKLTDNNNVGALNIACLLDEIERLQSLTQWVPGNVNPEWSDDLPGVYCENRWTGNDYEVYGCNFFCEIKYEGVHFFSELFYNFDSNRWEKWLESGDVVTDMKVLKWCNLPLPPEGVK